MMTVSAADMMMDAAMSFLAASLSRAPTLPCQYDGESIRQPLDEAEDEVDEYGSRTYSGEGILSDRLPDDDGVRKRVEELEEISADDGKREAKQYGEGPPLGEIDSHRRLRNRVCSTTIGEGFPDIRRVIHAYWLFFLPSYLAIGFPALLKLFGYLYTCRTDCVCSSAHSCYNSDEPGEACQEKEGCDG